MVNRIAAVLLLALPGCALLTEGRYYDQECTAFPDGPWTPCCLAHDDTYRAGGTEAERMAADDEFAACMLDYFSPEMVDWIHGIVREYGQPWWGQE